MRDKLKVYYTMRDALEAIEEELLEHPFSQQREKLLVKVRHSIQDIDATLRQRSAGQHSEN